METVLNLLWLALSAATAIVVLPRVPRHRLAHVALALACALVLLYPIISVSDDLSADPTLDVLAAVLVVVILGIALQLLAALGASAVQRHAFCPVVHADPRSPPRR